MNSYLYKSVFKKIVIVEAPVWLSELGIQLLVSTSIMRSNPTQPQSLLKIPSVSFSLSPSPLHSCTLSLFKINDSLETITVLN